MKVKHYIRAVILAFLVIGLGPLSLLASDVIGMHKSLPEKALLSYPVCPPDTNPPTLPQPDNNPLIPGSNNPFYLQNPPGVGPSIIYDPTTNTYNFQYMTGNTPMHSVTLE